VRAVHAAGILLLLAGLVALGLSVADGSARLYLVLLFPVITGSSPLFVLGLLGVVGGLIVFFLSAEGAAVGPGYGGRGTTPSGGRTSTSGGVVLIGPVPVFFGAWKGPSRRSYRLAVFLGCIFFVAALVLFFVLL
jgi:uncharacterized membrane protein